MRDEVETLEDLLRPGLATATSGDVPSNFVSALAASRPR
jgi:hypothetical protein